MSERGRCKSCNAQILWVETENGKKMPLDFESPEARFVIDASKNPMRARLRKTYVSHFAVCPHAERWRGKGDGQ